MVGSVSLPFDFPTVVQGLRLDDNLIVNLSTIYLSNINLTEGYYDGLRTVSGQQNDMVRATALKAKILFLVH